MELTDEPSSEIVDHEPRADIGPVPCDAARNGKCARAFDQNSPSADIGAGAPAINVAETKDAYEVTAELPGVDEKDIKVSLDQNQLVISGEKKAESTTEEKDWHVEERSYG